MAPGDAVVHDTEDTSSMVSEKVDKIVASLDKNGDGVIDRDEFHGVRVPPGRSHPVYLFYEFVSLDRNRNLVIEPGEIDGNYVAKKEES